MRNTLIATIALIAAPHLAVASPVDPAGFAGYHMQVQYNCGPPRRVRVYDSTTGSMIDQVIPGRCDGPRRSFDDRPVYRDAPRRYYDDRPVYREPRRYYDEDRGYRPRRPPPPGWERDPYTGRDMRILR
jgi:hypothetical protein